MGRRFESCRAHHVASALSGRKTAKAASLALSPSRPDITLRDVYGRSASIFRYNPAMRTVIAVLLLAALAQPPADQLYQATLIQAAPGKLTELLDLYKSQFAKQKDAPLWMRHSQGDFWDLLILTPRAGYSELR